MIDGFRADDADHPTKWADSRGNPGIVRGSSSRLHSAVRIRSLDYLYSQNTVA
jgi:hypothetical protein